MAKKAVDDESVERTSGYSPEVERLIAKGKEQGYVTQQEIAGVLPEAEENLEELMNCTLLCLSRAWRLPTRRIH